jgi:hypothetical protein
MKCSIHPEVDAVGVCVSCGKAVCSKCSNLVHGKIYCPSCVTNVSEIVERKQTGKPIAGGILGIIAGVFGFFIGIILIADGATVDYYWESVDWSEVGLGIALVILGILAILGSSFAIARKNFNLSVIGGVCAIPVWLLGVPALILIAMSRDEFQPVSASSTCISCGKENPKGSRFCSGCGRELTGLKPGV